MQTNITAQGKYALAYKHPIICFDKKVLRVTLEQPIIYQLCSLVAPSPCDNRREYQISYYVPHLIQDHPCSACKTINSHRSNICFSCGLIPFMSQSRASNHTVQFGL